MANEPGSRADPRATVAEGAPPPVPEWDEGVLQALYEAAFSKPDSEIVGVLVGHPSRTSMPQRISAMIPASTAPAPEPRAAEPSGLGVHTLDDGALLRGLGHRRLVGPVVPDRTPSSATRSSRRPRSHSRGQTNSASCLTPSTDAPPSTAGMTGATSTFTSSSCHDDSPVLPRGLPVRCGPRWRPLDLGWAWAIGGMARGGQPRIDSSPDADQLTIERQPRSK